MIFNDTYLPGGDAMPGWDLKARDVFDPTDEGLQTYAVFIGQFFTGFALGAFFHVLKLLHKCKKIIAGSLSGFLKIPFQIVENL